MGDGTCYKTSTKLRIQYIYIYIYIYRQSLLEKPVKIEFLFNCIFSYVALNQATNKL